CLRDAVGQDAARAHSGDRNPPPRLVGPGGLVTRCRNAGGRDLTSLQPAGRAPEPRDPRPPALAAAEPDRPVRGPRRPGTLPRFRPGAVLVVPEPADAARRLYLRVRRRLQGPLVPVPSRQPRGLRPRPLLRPRAVQPVQRV